MSMLDSLRSVVSLLTAKLYPPEPRTTSAESDTGVPPPVEELTPEQVEPEVYAEDIEEDEDTESSKTGQQQTEIDELRDNAQVLEERLAAAEAAAAMGADDAGATPYVQILCKLQENIAAGATGSIKQAVYQNSVISGWQIVEFGPAYTGYNCGATDGVSGDVALLQQGDHGCPSFQISRGAAVVDQTQIISREAAVAGTATTPPRSDGVQGLKLVGTPGDQIAAAEPVHTLGFWKLLTVGTRWGLGIIFGTHTVVAAHYPSLEGAVDANGTDGARLKLGTYGTSRSALDVQSDGVGVPLATDGAIVDTGSGPEVNTGNGLEIATNIIKVKADTSGLAVSVGASGVKVAIPKLDDLAATDDNADLDASTSAHGLLKKLGGGTANFLRADGSWATPPGAGLSVATATLPSDHALSGADWDTILTLTAPGTGSALVIANFGTDLSPMYGRITDDGTLCSRMGGTPSYGCCMAIVGGGSTVDLDLYDDGLGRSALASECYLIAIAL